MGLRCLLGHNFGEPEVERDRKEDGNEVVITVQEVKTCTRCGDQQVVSENKEVTSLDQLTNEAAVVEEQVAAGRDGTARDPSGPESTTPASGPDKAVDAADPSTEGTVIDDAENEGLTDDVSGEIGADTPPAGEPAAEGAGAEIIDDGPSDDERAEPEPTVDLSEAAESGDPTEPTASGGEPAAADAEAEDSVGQPPEADADTPDGDAEIIEETETAETGVDDTADPETVADEVPGGSEAEPETDPATDDGVILDEESEAPPERGPGEWPAVEEKHSDVGNHTPWPDQRGEDEGYDATVDDGTDAEVSFGGGLTPEATEQTDVDEEAEFIETPDGTEGGFIATAEESITGDASEGPQADPEAEAPSAAGGNGGSNRSGTLTGSLTDQVSEYYCPECGLAEIAGDSSMRAGDICPECKRGYVAERPAE